jgi:hypothetical protein
MAKDVVKARRMAYSFGMKPFHAVPNGTRAIHRGTQYIYVKVATGPRRWITEHRVIAAEKIGRKLLSNEHVHHIDGNKQNNAPSNLRVMLGPEHHKLHRQQEKERRPVRVNPKTPCHCGCGKLTPKFDERGRKRSGFIHGHNPCLPVDRVMAMFALYSSGLSLASVGKFYRVTGQAIAFAFKSRKLPTRPRRHKEHSATTGRE